MASNTTKLTGDEVFKFTVNGDEEDSALDEDDFDKEKQSSHQSFDELESDLKKNKHCTDADVLKAVSVFSERASPVNPSDRQITPQDYLLKKVSSIIEYELFPDNNSVHSLEYWSEEEGQYPPQMSLSPLPCEPTYRMTVKIPTTNGEKEQSKTLKTSNNVEDSNKCDEAILQMKRTPKRTLSPILSKHSNYPSYSHKYRTSPKTVESFPQTITPSFLINSTENVAKSMISPQPYNWKPRPPDDWTISSPSLVRPTIPASPKTRKYKQSSLTTEITPLNYSNRMKEDKFLDQTKRYSMPKRIVSRSQSTKTTTTKLFPAISKSQTTSKSISDFRQSSSLFGKLIRRNMANERANDQKKDNVNKQGKPADSTPIGETTRKKLRRVLSLH